MNAALQSQAKAKPASQAASSSMPAGLLRRHCTCGGAVGVEGECAECRQTRLQGQSVRQAGATALPPIMYDAQRFHDQPFDPAVRAPIEPHFGHDFSQAEVHPGAAMVGRNYDTESCPVFPRTCSFGGAYHTCPIRIQAKLTVNKPEDKYEQEADRVADQILRPQKLPEEEEDRTTEIQTKLLPQAARDDRDVNGDLEGRLDRRKGSGHSLSDQVRSLVEPRLAHHFGEVRIHTDSEAAQMNEELGAQAFTYGRDIYFGASKYSPHSAEGQKLLAHELVHVVQQTGRMEHERSPANHLWETVSKGILGDNAALDQVIQRHPDPPAWAVQLQAELRRPLADGGFGIDFWREDPFGNLSEEEARRAVELFRQIPDGGARGGRTRIANAWNNNRDHLQSDYHSVLEFLLFMDDFFIDTLGHGVVEVYGNPARYLPSVTLAGATGLVVHPWALYFVAAAQVGMDIVARRSQGQGHYIAPASMYTELGFIHHDVDDYLRLARSGSARSSLSFHTSIRRRLSRVLEVVCAQQAAQQTGPAYHPSEVHREPALVRWVSEPGRLAALLTNMQEAHSSGDAMARLVGIRDALSTGLGELPRRVGEHGWAALDPHGTLHGVGLALDLFNSTNREAGLHGTNFSILEQAWPFIQYLVREHGTEYGFSGGESSTEFETNTPQGAQRRFNLGGLIQRHWPELRRQMESPTIYASTPPNTELMRDYDRALGDLRQMLQRRTNALHQRTVRNFGRHPALRDAAAQAVEAMRQLRDRCEQMSPDVLVRDLEHVISLLNRAVDLANHIPSLSEEAQRAVTTAVPAHEDSRQDLTILRDALQVDLPALRPAFASRELQQLRLAYRHNEQQIRRWFAIVSDREERIFDQPPEFMAGVLSVQGTSFYGGHHWQVDVGVRPTGSEGPALPSIEGYRSALRQDLARRSPDTLRRILTTMAETPAGSRALFEDTEQEGADRVLQDELQEWTREPGRPSYDDLKLQVQSSIRAYGGPAADLLQSLQAMGYHQLVDELASSFGARSR